MNNNETEEPLSMTVDEAYDMYYTNIDEMYDGDMVKVPYMSVPLEEGQKSNNIQFLFDVSAGGNCSESLDEYPEYAFKQVIKNKDGSAIIRRGRIRNDDFAVLIINEIDADGNKTKIVNPNGSKGLSWYPMDREFIAINPDDTISRKFYDIDEIKALVTTSDVVTKIKNSFITGFKDSPISEASDLEIKIGASLADNREGEYQQVKEQYAEVLNKVSSRVIGRSSFLRIEKNIPCGHDVVAQSVDGGYSYDLRKAPHRVRVVEYEPAKGSAEPTSLAHNELCLYYEGGNAAGKYFRHTEELLDEKGSPSGQKIIFTAPLDKKDQFHCGIARLIGKDEKGKRTEKLLVSKGGYKEFGDFTETFYAIDRKPNNGKRMEIMKLPIDSLKLALKECRERHQATTR